MVDTSAIPGAADLVGKGIYLGVPPEIPLPVRDGRAVVVGGATECAAVARRLADAGWTVRVVPRHRKRGSELVCATGVEYLEALVLRRTGTRRIEACNASALFIL